MKTSSIVFFNCNRNVEELQNYSGLSGLGAVYDNIGTGIAIGVGAGLF